MGTVSADSSRITDLLDDWYRKINYSRKAHYLAADGFRKYAYWLGVPTVIISLFVGTLVFATFASKPIFWLQVAVGLCSVLAALLAGLQTFLGYSERSEKHRMAGARYGALRREMDVLRTSPDLVDSNMLDSIRAKMDALALESPLVSNRIRDVVRK